MTPTNSTSESYTYAPSASMTRLLHSIARHPDLDMRLWAAMTVMINLDMGDPNTDAEDVVLDVVAPTLIIGNYTDHLEEPYELTRDPAGAVTDVHYEAVYGDDERAAALLAIMKLPDVHARQLALMELAKASAGQAGEAEVVSMALLRLADWLSNESFARH